MDYMITWGSRSPSDPIGKSTVEGRAFTIKMR